MIAGKIKLPDFDQEKVNIKEYLVLFEMTADINGITTNGTKKSFLLSFIGIENYAVVCKLAAPNKPSEQTLQEIIDLLKNHFITVPTYHRAL